jgi:hypothetical protein
VHDAFGSDVKVATQPSYAIRKEASTPSPARQQIHGSENSLLGHFVPDVVDFGQCLIQIYHVGNLQGLHRKVSRFKVVSKQFGAEVLLQDEVRAAFIEILVSPLRRGKANGGAAAIGDQAALLTVCSWPDRAPSFAAQGEREKGQESGKTSPVIAYEFIRRGGCAVRKRGRCLCDGLSVLASHAFRSKITFVRGKNVRY